MVISEAVATEMFNRMRTIRPTEREAAAKAGAHCARIDPHERLDAVSHHGEFGGSSR